ncbi:MAG: glycine betaine ABC transporter substrate-binding protein [Bacillota bacterium]
MKKLLAFALSLTLVFTLAACGGGSDSEFSEYPEIVGIESGAGIMEATDTAIEEYDLNMDLQTSSGPAMVSALGDAIENEEWVVVTGWTPHYKFAEYDLKFLEDPEGVYGEEEDLYTIGRSNLENDHPDLVTFLENFYMEEEELGDLMGDIAENDDDDTIDIARDWMEDNEDVWEEWIPEGIDGEGTELNIPYVNWAEGVAMTHLVQALLIDEMGYDVEVTQADAGPIFQDVSSADDFGESDFFLDAWFPVTHQSYRDKHEGDFDEIGVNFEGARIGLVVPEYVDIDSIDELNDYLD